MAIAPAVKCQILLCLSQVAILILARSPPLDGVTVSCR